ncbi:MAG: polyprenol monophosphomannose synthase [Thermoguttaceae bacterium]
MKKILIAVATYNERENIIPLVDAIFENVPTSGGDDSEVLAADVLVVDDNSPDGTADLVQDKMKDEPRLKILKRSGKLGLGTAVIAAMEYAIENGYDFFVNMDADWSHDPKFLAVMLDISLKQHESTDVVIGSRYVQGGKIVGWPITRKIMSRIVNAYARLMLGLPSKDNSGSFRCYKVATLKKLDFSKIRSKGYSFFEEILYRLRKTGAKFTEVPITFTDRIYGKSKINKKEALRALWIIGTLRLTGFAGEQVNR